MLRRSRGARTSHLKYPAGLRSHPLSVHEGFILQKAFIPQLTRYTQLATMFLKFVSVNLLRRTAGIV